jgi:diguanylate cyclase (GGDEF)-like protein/PAS domain S-box-containing protein
MPETAKRAVLKALARPIGQINAVKEAQTLPAEWQIGFFAHSMEATSSKLALYSIALWGLQAAGACFYVYQCANGLISVFGLAVRLVFSAVYIAVISAMNQVALNQGGRSAPKAEYGVLLYLTAMTLGQIANAALDLNGTIIVYRLIITAVIVAMLPETRTEKTLATTGALYTVIFAAIILIRPGADDSPLPRLPAVVCAVAGAEFICFFVRAHNVVVYAHRRETEDAAKRLEQANHKLKAANEALEKLSTTDALTQAANRRAFDAYAARTWNECRRLRKHLAVLMMDIDHFKAFNDYYGHLEGDECLKTVADTAKRHFNRSVDLFARYGGEEFVAVLPFTKLSSAARLAEEVRADVESLRMPNPHSAAAPYVTVSVGAACVIPHDETPEALVKLADEALYEAKESGRNRVVSYGHGAEREHLHKYEFHEEFERLRAALRGTEAAMFVIDLAGDTLEFSREFITFTGLDRHVFDPYTEFSFCLNPKDRDKLDAMMEDIKHGGEHHFEPLLRLVSTDRREIAVRMTARRVLAPNLAKSWAFGVIWVYREQGENGES